MLEVPKIDVNSFKISKELFVFEEIEIIYEEGKVKSESTKGSGLINFFDEFDRLEIEFGNSCEIQDIDSNLKNRILGLKRENENSAMRLWNPFILKYNFSKANLPLKINVIDSKIKINFANEIDKNFIFEYLKIFIILDNYTAPKFELMPRNLSHKVCFVEDGKFSWTIENFHSGSEYFLNFLSNSNSNEIVKIKRIESTCSVLDNLASGISITNCKLMLRKGNLNVYEHFSPVTTNLRSKIKMTFSF